MNILNEIIPQKFIEELCGYYNKLDAHLKHPRSGSIQYFNEYSFVLDEKTGIKITRYIRNATALEKLQAFIDRLDTFFIGVEYFQGNIELRRKKGNELPEKFVNDFFIEVMMDSIRSSLDIFAMFVAWFYDLAGKETLGFNYNNFIEPLKQVNLEMSQRLNKIYKSAEFEFIKEIRDANRHFGKGQNKISIEESISKFKIEFKRSSPINITQVAKTVNEMLNKLIEVSTFAVNEFCKTNLGYDSKKDFTILFLDDKGNFKRL